MVKMQNLPTTLALLLFASTSSALHIRARQPDVLPTPVAQLSNDAAAALITPGPSLDAVGDLRLARQVAAPTMPACATSCIASAVTKSTNCKLGDTRCECNNASVVNAGAAPCVQSACGYVTALLAQAVGEEVCISVLNAPATPTGNNNPPEQSVPSSSSHGASPSPSEGSDGGSSGGSSGGSDGGSSGGSHGGSSGSSGSSGDESTPHKPGKKLSGGAIGGIVVGVVAGIAAAAGAIWKFCLNKMKGGNAPAAGDDPAAPAPVVVAPVQTAQVSPYEVEALKPSATPQTVSSVSPIPGSTTTTSPVYPTTSPVYPNAAELPHGSYPQPPAAYAYPPHSLGQTYHEAHVQPPEMAGDTHIPQELHGGAPVYEMGSH